VDRAGRLFLCARCRDQVLLCSQCDRGQQYCGRACASLSRRERRREAARRYQSSWGGRLKHAARAACWRERGRRLRDEGASADTNKVTHQGCSQAPADASLLECDTPSACELTTIVTDSTNDTALASVGTVQLAALACRRCTQLLAPHVRQGYLRASSVRRRSDHDHFP
jgi:hypothetical protein